MPMMMPSSQTGGLASALNPQTGGLASALNPQTGGLLQRLLGQQGGSGIGQRLTDLLDPRVALPMAGAMMAGRTPGEGFGRAFQLGGIGLHGIGEEHKDEFNKQRTMTYLSKAHPELAQMVEMGMPIGDAYKEALKLDHPDKKNNWMSVGDGTMFNTDTEEVRQIGQRQAKPPSIETLYDAQGNEYKGQWNAVTGQYDKIGGSKAPPTKAPTEQVVRNRQLYKVVAPEVKNLLGDATTPGKFDALASTASQAGDFLGNLGKSVGAGDLSGYTTSGEYQSAKNSLKTIVASYLYSVSGATANPGEVETQTNVLMPKPGEDPQSVADKKERIKTMVEAVRSVADGTGNDVMSPVGSDPASGGWSVEVVP